MRRAAAPAASLLAGVLVAASAAATADPPTPVRIERTPEFQSRVGKAIDRGVEWIREAQTAAGSIPEYREHPGATTAFAYHAMRACGVPRDDVAASNARNALRRGYRNADLKTYTAVLRLMAIASHGDPIPGARDDRDVRLSAADARWAAEIANCLAGGRDADGRWTYQVDVMAKAGPGASFSPRAAGLCDHGNTQYALLDLVLARWRRATDVAVKTRLFDGATSIGPRIVEPLLSRLESTDADKRAAAHALLARATGVDFGWRADASSDARENAVLKWQTWWMAAKDKIVYDPAAKRLVAR